MGLLHDDPFTVQVHVGGAWMFVHAPRGASWSLTKDRRLAGQIKDPVYGPGCAAYLLRKGLVEVGTPWRVVAGGWRGERVVLEGVVEVVT